MNYPNAKAAAKMLFDQSAGSAFFKLTGGIGSCFNAPRPVNSGIIRGYLPNPTI